MLMSDAENQRWKMTLRTLTRHGSDWAPVGESERGIPPINLVFSCADSDLLESTGTVTVPHVLTNSPACRVLAGLTKKVANKLGGPLDVMTEKWLPSKHLRLAACPEEAPRVKSFNPFYWYGYHLRLWISSWDRYELMLGPSKQPGRGSAEDEALALAP
jgi:hypothetical protein